MDTSDSLAGESSLDDRLLTLNQPAATPYRLSCPTGFPGGIMPRAYQCPVCRARPRAWLPGPGGRQNATCPQCGSLERHRFLALLLNRIAPVVTSSRLVVEVAPTPVVRRMMRKRVGRRYVGLDLGLDRRRIDLFADLTRLPLADGAVDLMVVFHVLEHIPDDASAIREMSRTLGPSGLAIVQVPWRRTMPETIEDPDAPPAVRAARFGQEDHVRYYGADFEARLHAGGLTTLRIEPAEALDVREVTRYNITADAPIWLCVPKAPNKATLDDLVDYVQSSRGA